MDQKILIAYFSRPGNNYVGGSIVNLPVGNTEIAAKKLAALTGGELFRIERVTPYSDDYRACVEEAKEELRADARPQLKALPGPLDGYGAVIVGYPSWCGTMPMPVWTFLEALGLSGRVILPLCTNEGSGLGRSVDDIKRLCPHAEVREGLSVRGGAVASSDALLEEWLQKTKLI